MDTVLEKAINIQLAKRSSVKNGLSENKLSFSDEVSLVACLSILEDTIKELQSLLPDEKEQIIDTYSEGNYNGHYGYDITAEQYYQNTFKK